MSAPHHFQVRDLAAAPPSLGDLDDLIAMYADERVMATLGGLRSADRARADLERMIAHWERHGFSYWTFRRRQTGAYAGRCGLLHTDEGGPNNVEVGYGLLPEYWGQGYASAIAAELVRIGFEDLGLAELVCFTMTTNRASQRVMEKAGFRYERDFVRAGLPHVFYRLRQQDWQAGKPSF